MTGNRESQQQLHESKHYFKKFEYINMVSYYLKKNVLKSGKTRVPFDLKITNFIQTVNFNAQMTNEVIYNSEMARSSSKSDPAN